MNTLLVFPPYWCASHPYLSLPCLSAYLKKNKVNVDVLDLNIKSLNMLLSSDFIKQCKNIIENNIDELKYKRNLLLYDYVIDNIDDSVTVFKNEADFFNFEKYNKAKMTVSYALSIISKAYEPLKIGLNSLSFIKDLTFDSIIEFSTNVAVNPFINIFKELLNVENIKEYEHIAISLIGFEQILPTFTLCNYIKSVNPNIHITIGGSIFSKLYSELESNLKIFDYIDSILVFEGEEPLYRLILALAENKDLHEVPNLIYYDHERDKLIKNPINKLSCNINDLPVPDFSQYNFKEYLSPKVILPYFLSRSCYWSKCSFCDHDYGYDGKYRIKNFDNIIQEIKSLKKLYDVKILHIIDEAVSPKILNTFCDKLIEANVEIQWFCYIKASEEFTIELCNKMKLAGCLQILVGVESCSDFVLKSMNKGINKHDIEITLKNMDQCGIWSHVFLINNFPTETAQNKLESIFFILKNIEYFHSLGMGDFSLLKNAKMLKNKESYGIEEVFNKSPLVNNLEYKSKLGNESLHNQTVIINDIFMKFSKTNELSSKHILYREHIPLYLSKYELILNKNLVSKLYNGNLLSDNDKRDEKYNSNLFLYEKCGSKVMLFNFYTGKNYEVNEYMLDILKIIENSIIEKSEFINELRTLGHKDKNIEAIWIFLKKSNFIKKVKFEEVSDE